MRKNTRDSGIDIVGEVPWGTHFFCQFYQTKEDLMDILIPYFKAGLENNELCIWVASELLSVEETKEALRKSVRDFDIYLERGQIEIIPCTHWYVKEDIFNFERVMNRWIEKLNKALANSYNGLRLTEDTSWLKKENWNDFVNFERKLDNIIGNYQIVALRTYSLGRCNAAGIINEVINHQLALIKEKGKREQAESSNRQNITECKRAEKVLRQSEQCTRLKLESVFSPAREMVNLELAEIVDVQAIQSLMENFYKLVHIPIGLNDLKGNVLVGVGWQDICTKFHRVNPEACKHCVESDINLTAGVNPGGYKLYKCKNNMWDIVTPIMVGDQHVGYVFAGQFFFEDEPLDYELFRSQARQYGFNEEEYIAALEKVPRLSREAVDTSMDFFMTFASMISQLSYSNIKLTQSLAERDTLVDALRESREDFDRAQVVGNIGSWRMDVRKNELTWSDENHRIFGIPKGTPLTYETFLSTVHPDDRKSVDKEWKEGLEGKPYDIEHRIIANGKIKWVREKAYLEFDKGGALIGGFGITQDITERKKAEEELRLASKYNRSLIEASVDPLVTIGPDGKITDVNNSTEAVTGRSRYELIGTDFSDYFTEPEKAKEGYQRAFKQGLVRDYPLEIQHKDGHITPVLHNASVYKDEAGKVIGIFAAARDISELKKAEEKIRILANAVESSDDAIITKSLDRIITSWNKGAEKIYGYSVEEVLGRSISILEPENLRGEAKQLIEKIKRGERIRHYETVGLKKDGTKINISITLSPVFDTSGKLVAISTIARDITQRIKAEEALRLSNIYNRSLIEASLDPLVTIGPDGKITDVNGATELVTGYSRNELIGTDFSDYFTEPEKAREGYQQVFTYGEVRDYPLEIRHREGHITPVLYNASVYKDEAGKIIGVFAAARDITERKKAEEVLRLKATELARKKEIHHRIKNNLQVISSLLDLQAEKFGNMKYVKDSEVLEAFRESQDRVASIALIHEELHEGEETDTLNFSQYLEKLIGNLFQTYRFGNTDLSLKMDLEENVFFDMDIAVPLGIIVNELVSNSLKHAFPDRGKGEIRIKLFRQEIDKSKTNIKSNNRKKDSTSAEITLAVSDNGAGISESIDIENSDTLGLQLINTLVDQLEGEIELKKENGTEFIIRISVEEMN